VVRHVLREDVGGATLWERSDLLGFGGKKGRDGLRGGALYYSSVKGNVGRS
jgi:hypothetical protein